MADTDRLMDDRVYAPKQDPVIADPQSSSALLQRYAIVIRNQKGIDDVVTLDGGQLLQL